MIIKRKTLVFSDNSPPVCTLVSPVSPPVKTFENLYNIATTPIATITSKI